MTIRLAMFRWSAASILLAAGASALGANWPAGGNDLTNSRYQAAEKKISPKTVSALTLKWAVATDGDVPGTPAVDSDSIYFADVPIIPSDRPPPSGSLYRVSRATGEIMWKKPISGYTGAAGDFARATPAIVGNTLILGNQAGKLYVGAQPAKVFAVDKRDGSLLWVTQVDYTPFSYVTHAPIVYNGTAFVGTSSNEELLAGFIAPYPFAPPTEGGWGFRGSIVALDVATGSIKWQTYTVPVGYTGGSVWGSTGAVDPARNQLYMATGDNFSVPGTVQDCLALGGTPATCLDPADYFDSILALDMTTGAIKWAGRGLDYDAWNVGCGLIIPGVIALPFPDGTANVNCPAPYGPDWDFAQGPMMFSDGPTSDSGLVGAGQKSGKFWAFKAQTGTLAWSTQVTPGGVTGGMQWGSATDGKTIFVAASNAGPAKNGAGHGALPWTLMDGTTTTTGGWAAIDGATGSVVWTTKDPQLPSWDQYGYRAEGPVSGANGVVFGCNLDGMRGTMFALDARSGKILWSYDSNPNPYGYGACNTGASIADGTVYWGTGSSYGAGPHLVYAFGL